MTELQAKLQELRELVEAKTVVCPRCYGLGALPEYDIDIQPSPCDACDGTGHIPDQAYAPLLEVILEPHVGSDSYGNIEHIWRLRAWDSLPRGALAGALKVTAYSPAYWYVKTPWHSKDIDLIALEYVLDVLKEKAK